MARTDVRAVLRQQDVVEPCGVDVVADVHESDAPTPGLDPFKACVGRQPVVDDLQSGAYVVDDGRNEARSLTEYPPGDRFVDGRATDDDLFLRRQQRLGELTIATHRPTNPQSGQAVRL